jgi:hypothetical protein
MNILNQSHIVLGSVSWEACQGECRMLGRAGWEHQTILLRYRYYSAWPVEKSFIYILQMMYFKSQGRNLMVLILLESLRKSYHLL